MNIDDIIFKNPILNSSGCWCNTKEQIEKLYNSDLGGIVLKTCSLYPNDGNGEINYYHNKRDDIRLNCKGLPNRGYEYYKNIVLEYDKKPLILSITIQNYDELRYILLDYDFCVKNKVMVEINMSCPNIEYRIPGYHCKDILKLIEYLRDLNTRNIVYGIKLPPIFEIEKCIKIAKILNNYNDIIRFIVCSNTIPNGYTRDVKLSNVYGGISGRINKYIALSNVKTFNNILKNTHIIGCGGIYDTDDIVDYIDEGASLVQIGSSVYNDEIDELDIDKINEIIVR
jgi:dihydroorotate dehydrogenase (fumarate)